MADEGEDDSQKTEDPTPKRLRESREKGEVAKSQELGHWFMILAFASIAGVFGPWLAESISQSLVVVVERPHLIDLSEDGSRQIVIDILVNLGLALLPVVLVVLVAALGGSVLQTGLLFSVESLKPKLSKISLIEGFKRQFSSRSLMEFAKGILKISLVAGVVVMAIWPKRDRLNELAQMEMKVLLEVLQETALIVLIAVLAMMTVIAAIDFTFQRYQHIKKLRMTRQEVKDEFKQTEGDPMVKARLRQIRQERARGRMMAAVPTADVVITNPTHYAIALKYEMEAMTAPKVVAKGIDHLALRIREVAEENDIPLVENRPLARALHDSVDLDQEVPPEHYKAVAQVIGYVMRLKGKGRR
ncbi:flagellar biosynthesis protein FlhB [Algihabitans albus]|uniref:flagellar biosynthesis protein FlhB n=1 Tax=Algihabitans albus TaxID=2164067 RepID=UPI000E5C87D5|nr:flagellar biosynthesis protein FlhB [Algihabitans albus]